MLLGPQTIRLRILLKSILKCVESSLHQNKKEDAYIISDLYLLTGDEHMGNDSRMTEAAHLRGSYPSRKGNLGVKQSNCKNKFSKITCSKYWKARGTIFLGKSGAYVFLCICHNYTKGPPQTIWLATLLGGAILSNRLLYRML